jgi:hypothetical protein
VFDGVYTRNEKTGTLEFHQVPAPLQDEMESLVAVIARRVERFLTRQGFGKYQEAGPTTTTPCSCSSRHPWTAGAPWDGDPVAGHVAWACPAASSRGGKPSTKSGGSALHASKTGGSALSASIQGDPDLDAPL